MPSELQINNIGDIPWHGGQNIGFSTKKLSSQLENEEIAMLHGYIMESQIAQLKSHSNLSQTFYEQCFETQIQGKVEQVLLVSFCKLKRERVRIRETWRDWVSCSQSYDQLEMKMRLEP